MSAELIIRAILKDEFTASADKIMAAMKTMGAGDHMTKEFRNLEAALQDNIMRLQAQKELLSDPVYAESARNTHQITEEVKLLNAANIAGAEAEKVSAEATNLTVRSRRELMVMMHEASQGRYKNLAGSAMVLEEGDGGAIGAIQGAVAMMGGPLVAASAVAAVAVAGVTKALWDSAEAGAEQYHQFGQLAATLGVSTEAMYAFKELSVGTTVTTDELARTFGRFTINLGEHSDKLAKLGITAKEPIAAFEQLMDVARNTEDPIQRNTILNEALGRGWEKLAPVLLQGGDALKQAVEAMKIPDETIKNFERANEAQIAISKTMLEIKNATGGAMSGARAWFKELELGAVDLMHNASWIKIATVIGSTLTPVGGLTNIPMLVGLRERGKNLLDAQEAKGSSPAEGIKAYTEEQKSALEAAQKEMGKSSLAIALQNARSEWAGRLEAFKVGSEEYKKVLTAELEEEAQIRKAFAKRGAVRGGGMAGARADIVVDEDGNLRDGSGIAGQSIGAKLTQMSHADTDKAAKERQKYLKDELASDQKLRDDANKQNMKRFFEMNDAETKVEADAWKHRSQLATSYADTLSSTMDSAYTDIWKNGRDTFDALRDAFGEMLTNMAIQMAAKASIFALFSMIPGGGALLGGTQGASLGSSAMSYIFGARATGGAVFPGVTYRKNEDAYGGGGEPFRPSSAGTISPNRSGGGGGGFRDLVVHVGGGVSASNRAALVRDIRVALGTREVSVARGI